MSHDKIRAAARERMAVTGEPYAAARRAVIAEHQADSQVPSSGAGYALRMSGEIHDWLAALRDSDPTAVIVVVRALAALLNEGARLGEPLVASTADSWAWALAEALDRSYREKAQRLSVLRRCEADAAALVKDIKEQVSELESVQAALQDEPRRLLAAGRPQESAQAAGMLAAAQREATRTRLLLPEAIEARRRLGEEIRRRQAGVDAFRERKEVLKASYVAAYSSLTAHQAIAAAGLADDSQGEAADTAEARLLRDVTAQMEQELGQQAWPEGLMELRPAGPWGTRLLFSVEPPGTVLLIAVLDGPEAVRQQSLEAIVLSAEMLRRVRAGQAPEATVYGYDNTRCFLEEFYPATS